MAVPAGLRPFTPAQESAARLAGRTVGNEALLLALERLLLDAARTGNRPHTLLVGPAGSGKSHLLRVAVHRALVQASVAEQLVFIRFDEDALGLSRLLDVLTEALRQLTPARSGAAGLPADQYEAALAGALGDRLLVVLIENLDRVAQAMGPAGQRDFRDWLQRSDRVLVLATAQWPVPAVSEPAAPWHELFAISQSDELDLTQRRALLVRLAAESPDRGLAGYLATGSGQARLRALATLVGGSPRAWTILADCLTVDSLAALLPALHALLERLVPFHQQLLWNLSTVEQRLVRALADGPYQAGTVAELAGQAGVSQRVAASTLGRLADSRIVLAGKVAGLDQRLTWYRLREPLLRHHLQYRSAAEQPLPLLVQLVKAWHLSGGATGLPSGSEPIAPAGTGSPFDVTAAQRDPQAVLAAVRFWGHDSSDGSAPDGGQAGALVELMLLALRHDWRGAVDLVDRGLLDSKLLGLGRTLVTHAHAQDPDQPAADRFELLLGQAAEATAGRTHAILELVAACWDGGLDPRRAQQRLAALASANHRGSDRFGSDRFGSDRFGLDVQRALAYWTGEAGDPASACELAARLLSGNDDQHLPGAQAGSAQQVLQRNLGRLLDSTPTEATPAGAAEQAPVELEPGGLIGLLRAALAGSAEALVRLPDELRPMVESARSVAAKAVGGHP
ncbi:MAG: ATP-binding protein [Jatrophihabitantaceae bacterium]